jgi:hypothetical protein
MKNFMFVLVITGLAAGLADAQTNHPAKYLFGGRGSRSPSTLSPYYVFIYDNTGATPVIQTLCAPPSYMTRYPSLIMDYDNRNLIMAMDGTSSTTYPDSNTIQRYDMTTNTWSSIWRGKLQREHLGPGSYEYQYPNKNVFIDQNGDTLWSYYHYTRQTSPNTLTTDEYGVLMLDRSTNTVGTIITSLSLGMREVFWRCGADIDTGKLLITGSRSQTSPTTMHCAVHTLDPEDGYRVASHGFWNDGSVYGWGNGYSITQNVKNGYLETPGMSGKQILQLRPGSGGRTTIASIWNGHFPSYVRGYSGKFDLQTAANPIYRFNTYDELVGMWILNYDVNTWTYTGYDTLMTPRTNPEYRYFYNYEFEFYQGRHIQTVETGNDRWDVRISVPHLPNKGYVAGLSATGVRPAIPLMSGRTINLAFDVVLLMTANNLLMPYWNPGPLVLNGQGEATATLDLSGLSLPANGLGVPLWIGVVVLDLAAPDGIAYIPDTYVIRI